MSAPPRSIPPALYASAVARYRQFVEALKPLVGQEHNADFGKHTLKPSQLVQLLNDQHNFALTMAAAMRSPMYDPKTGALMALSMDANGMITEEQFKMEQEEVEDKRVEKKNELIDLCNSTNEEIKAMMQAEGFTVTEFYEEYNRRWTRSQEQLKVHGDEERNGGGIPRIRKGVSNAVDKVVQKE